MRAGPPKHIETILLERIEKDLSPPFSTIQTKVAVSSIIGGLLSLFICGQFGVGFTSVAQSFSHHIHETMDPLTCALICGASYAVFPVLVLRFLLCHPLQFKAIVYRHSLSVFAWYGGFGIALTYFGHHGNDIFSLLTWVIAALVTTLVLSRAISKLVPTWTLADRHLGLT